MIKNFKNQSEAMQVVLDLFLLIESQSRYYAKILQTVYGREY
jgi:hypothetical protein